jgi:hypothetical protein
MEFVDASRMSLLKALAVYENNNAISNIRNADAAATSSDITNTLESELNKMFLDKNATIARLTAELKEAQARIAEFQEVLA